MLESCAWVEDLFVLHSDGVGVNTIVAIGSTEYATQS